MLLQLHKGDLKTSPGGGEDGGGFPFATHLPQRGLLIIDSLFKVREFFDEPSGKAERLSAMETDCGRFSRL